MHCQKDRVDAMELITVVKTFDGTSNRCQTPRSTCTLVLLNGPVVGEKYCHIVSFHIVDLKVRQNRLKVGTDKRKLKVKMQSVSDDDVWKRLLEKPRFKLAVKVVFRLGRCYILWQVFGPATGKRALHTNPRFHVNALLLSILCARYWLYLDVQQIKGF